MPDHQLDWVHALFQLGQELSLANTDAMRQKLLDHIVAGFHAQSGSIALLDDDAQQLTLIAGTGTAANYVGSKIPWGERILGWVAKHSQAVCLNGDAAHDPRFKDMRLVNNPGHPVSALCWPLRVEKQTVGAISINRAPDQPPFTEQHLIDGAVMVVLISLVVDNMRTHDAYHRRIAELKAEKELRTAAEARLTAILDSSDAILSVNEQGCIMLFNKGAELVFGYSADEILGEPLERLLPPRFAGGHADHLLRFVESGDTHRLLRGRDGIWGLHKDGHEFPAEIGIAKVRAGDSLTFTVTLRDITERCKTEETRVRLTAIIESSTDIVGTVDPDGNVLYLNLAGRKLMEWSAAGPVSDLRLEDFHPPWALSQARYESIPYAIRDGSWQGESELRNRAGNIIPVSQLILAHRDEGGRLLYLSSIMRDISEHKKAEDALRARQRELEAAYKDIEQAQSQLLQSEKMASVGQLAAGVAHEINNPVGFVNSNLGTLQNYVADLFTMIAAYEQLETKLPQDDALQQLLALKKKLDLNYLRADTGDLVKESIDGLGRVKRIVQDLKEFSHVDSTEWQIADLHAGLDSTLNIAHNELKYKTTVVKEYGDMPQVECIASQINQVFMNLLVNAAHAIETRGTITIRSGQTSDAVWIEISDTGKGMSAEVQKHIFEPFFTTKPVGKGTGLGLSLAYGIVQKHHGHIEVESEAGKGTRFRIQLPIRQPEKKAAA